MRPLLVSRRSAECAAGARSTSSHLTRKRERPGGHPVFHNIGAVGAEQISVTRIVPRRWTDSHPGTGVCAVCRAVSVAASAVESGVGDGTHVKHKTGSGRVSRAAIAAALALEDVVGGERLVAFALASFANREQLAWPGAQAAAARAGLGRSRYLQARHRLLTCDVIEVRERGGGRGRSTAVLLRFAEGPRVDAPVNAELFETVLCYSRSSGPGRLLLASIAALADERRELAGVTADELRAAAGLARSTYRRARNALIGSGELELVRGRGGRGRSNCWRIADLRIIGQAGTGRPRRQGPTPPARPLMTPAAPRAADVTPAAAGEATCETKPLDRPIDGATASVKGAQDRTVSAGKGAQDRTVSAVPQLETRPERGPQREPEREPPNARAEGTGQPWNRGTPANPLKGGSPLASWSSKRATSPNVAAHAHARSASTSTLSIDGYGRRVQLSVRAG
jgi:hypothetical protein